MMIALTGSSSTGKTTLSDSLMKEAEFRTHVDSFLTTDARSLLRDMGHTSMDKMRRDELQWFQRTYLKRKQEIEAGQRRFLTDRSFVDVAAYWLRRDAMGLEASEIEPVVNACREGASKYDLHIYCPFGVFPFKPDGYRSDNVAHHQEIGEQIAELLKDWGVKFITLDTPDHSERIARVLEAIRSLAAR
ncbi:MAG TPA: ATP-binding protein [Myxococcaceae bacterium]|nr:ATP-binding protein [Myxococcaceae bacterium]